MGLEPFSRAFGSVISCSIWEQLYKMITFGKFDFTIYQLLENFFELVHLAYLALQNDFCLLHVFW